MAPFCHLPLAPQPIELDEPWALLVSGNLSNSRLPLEKHKGFVVPLGGISSKSLKASHQGLAECDRSLERT